ncbi:MAG: gluconate 2-dehydrogenase subunit 3 family protein [Bacteroidota bacterium]
MKRRKAIKNTAVLMGFAFGAPTMLAVMNGCKATPVDESWQPLFFSKEDANIIGEIAETILPETDTPGAKTAGVHKFIDEHVFKNFPTEAHQAIKSKFEAMKKSVVDKFGKSFDQLDMDNRIAFLKEFESEAAIFNEENTNEQDFHLWDGLKDLTITGFMTSEVGSKQFLVHDPIPGEYNGCVDLSSVGANWAI